MAILAQQYPVYQKAMRIIENIESMATDLNEHYTVITTTFAHQYETGLIIRFHIPAHFGMQQLNNVTAEILVIDETSFSVPINSSTFDAFAVPSLFPYSKQYAQVVPVGENNRSLTQATQNVLPYRGI